MRNDCIFIDKVTHIWLDKRRRRQDEGMCLGN